VRIFSHLYRKMIQWSHHRHAPRYLGLVSFIEASFFPIPPDVMLAPMSLAKPERAWWYATITTVMAVLGALLGYVIGMFFFKWVEPWIIYFGYMPTYLKVQGWFGVWGGWVMFVAGVTPIPFKLFTIAGGALNTALFPFVIGSLVGRALRFYLVAGLARLGGKKMHHWIERSVDRIGWAVLILLVVGFGIYWCVR
jgi:membrane protein YqaA with SNARE-associated domain